MRCVIELVDSGSRMDWREEKESVRSKYLCLGGRWVKCDRQARIAFSSAVNTVAEFLRPLLTIRSWIENGLPRFRVCFGAVRIADYVIGVFVSDVCNESVTSVLLEFGKSSKIESDGRRSE